MPDVTISSALVLTDRDQFLAELQATKTMAEQILSGIKVGFSSGPIPTPDQAAAASAMPQMQPLNMSFDRIVESNTSLAQEIRLLRDVIASKGLGGGRRGGGDDDEEEGEKGRGGGGLTGLGGLRKLFLAREIFEGLNSVGGLAREYFAPTLHGDPQKVYEEQKAGLRGGGAYGGPLGNLFYFGGRLAYSEIAPSLDPKNILQEYERADEFLTNDKRREALQRRAEGRSAELRRTLEDAERDGRIADSSGSLGQRRQEEIERIRNEAFQVDEIRTNPERYGMSRFRADAVANQLADAQRRSSLRRIRDIEGSEALSDSLLRNQYLENEADLYGNTDEVKRRRLSSRIAEESDKIRRERGEDAQRSFDARGGLGDQMRQLGERDISDSNQALANQTRQIVQQLHEQAMVSGLRGQGNNRAAGNLEFEQNYDRKTQALRDELHITEDIRKQASLIAEIKEREADREQFITDRKKEQARQDEIAIQHANQLASVDVLRSQGRNYEADKKSITGGFDERIQEARRNGREDVAKSLEGQRDAQLGLFNKRHDQGVAGINEEAHERELRNKGYNTQADVERLRYRYHEDMRDAAGDPAKQKALRRKAEADLQEIRQGSLEHIGFGDDAGTIAHKRLQNSLTIGLGGKIGDDFQKELDAQDKQDKKDTANLVKEAANALLAAIKGGTPVILGGLGG